MQGLVSSSWVSRKSETNTYDDFGHITRVTHADTTHMDNAYDAAGLLVSVQDENHVSPNTTYTYDEAARVKTVTQVLSTAPGGSIATTYGYDVHGNLNSVTDPNGNVTSYLYDDFGRMLRQTSTVSGVTTYEYDEAGNLTTTTDANGASTARTYDSANRILTATSTRSGSTTETVTWTYGDGTVRYGRGRVRTMSDPAGTTTYAYERRGALRLEQREVPGITSPFETAYRYDEDGNRSAIVYPSGRTVTFGYDDFGRPNSASIPSGSLVIGASYAPFGPLESLVLANGTTQTIQHDSRYRTTQNKLVATSTTLAQYDYAYDSVGNITQIHDGTDANYNRDFAYDDLNRLVTANSGSSLWGSGSFTYDRMGNMLTSTFGSASFSYQGTTPQLASSTEGGVTRNVSYDSAGNELAVGGNGSAYSARNFLAAADGLTYGYDGRGVRVTARVPKVRLRFSPDQVLGGTSTTGTVILAEPAPTGGASVSLSSATPSLVAVPSTVTVTAGNTSATFTATTSSVDTASAVAVTASYSSGSSSASVALIPDPHRLLSVTVDPRHAVGVWTPRTHSYNASATGTVTLASAAPTGGITVTLACPTDCTPANVLIPQGSTSATFAVDAYALECGILPDSDCPMEHEITGTYIASRTGYFTVHTVENWTEALKASVTYLSSLAATPTAVVGGEPITLTIDLSGPAPEGGVDVQLSSSDASIAVPSHIFVPEKQRSATLHLATASVESDTTISLTAEAAGLQRTTTITLRAAANRDHQPVVLGFSTRIATPYTASGLYERYSFYSPELQLLAESDTSISTPAIAYEYVWFAGRPLAQIDTASTTVHWTFADHLGTPILQTNASAAIDWRVEHEPFGRVRTVRLGATRHQPLRFPGQEYDDLVGDREYNIFRWYRNGWGRYTQADPILRVVGANSYAYADDDPTANIDPLGLWTTGSANPNQNTIICDGKGGIGVQIGAPGTPEQKACVGPCLVIHELSHKEDALQANSTVCKGKPYGLRVLGNASNGELKRSERKAHKKLLECLMTLKSLDPGNKACCKDLIDQAYDWYSQVAKQYE